MFFFSVGCTRAVERVQTSIYAWFPDGRVNQVTPNNGMFYQSCIHPLGESVIYSGAESGAPRIWRTDLKDMNTKALTPEGVASLHGVFSWDGKKIAFTSDMNSEKDLPTFTIDDIPAQGTPPFTSVMHIHVMDVETGQIRQLTSGDFVDQRPTFSPDGRYITFVRSSFGSVGTILPTLWTIPVDGSVPPQEIDIDGIGLAYRPWYTPDGQRIFFFTIDFTLRHRIASIDVNGGEMTYFASDDEGRSHGPFVSTDGKYLIIHSTRGEGENQKLWQFELPDGEPSRLLPPGMDPSRNIMHGTRSKNGVTAFDTFLKFSK